MYQNAGLKMYIYGTIGSQNISVRLYYTFCSSIPEVLECRMNDCARHSAKMHMYAKFRFEKHNFIRNCSEII